MRFSVSFGKRLLLLLCAFIVGFFVVMVLSTLLLYKFGADSTPALRILTVLQDLLAFIAPAIITAVIITRRPAELLAIDRKIPFLPLIFGVFALVASAPAMNMVMYANESIPLPENLHLVLQQMEDNAALTVKALAGAHTIPNLIMSVLIVAVLAGLSEEILFRGAFQRIMVTGGVNAHVAIWVAAFVFSMMHMQFFGFIPRILLGAFFGYMLWWTRCLWVPVILHAINNAIVVVSTYFSDPSVDGGKSMVDEIGHGSDIWAVVLSVVLVALGLWMVRRSLPENNEATS